MRVAAVQFKARKGDVAGSLSALCALAERAADGADLVVLPEMAATGYVFESRAQVAGVAEAPDGPTAAALADIARRHRSWLVCGFPERAGGQLFNSAMVLDDGGALRFVYRKTLLYDADMSWATPGDSGYRSFETDAGRFGVGICMDLNDDRFMDWVRSADLDVLAFPTNWVLQAEDPIDPWTYWAWRLGSAKTALVAANTWGDEGQVAFSGGSAILQRGLIRAHLAEAGDGICQCQVSSSSRRPSSSSSC